MDPDSSRWPKGGRRTREAGHLQVIVSDGRGRPLRDGGLSRWLAGIAPSRARGEIAVALVSDARIQKLNSQYRKKRAPTDVLSFPAAPPSPDRGRWIADVAPGIPKPMSRRARVHLGDIVIATGVARRQAREAGHSYETELRVLALHGLLHLLGYDHENPSDAGQMSRVEQRLRRRGGLAAGLIERS